MLFEQRLKEGIHADRISLAFRRWKRCQVVAGRRYRTGLDLIEVEAVDVVTPADIDLAQAAAAGYQTVGELLGGLRLNAQVPLYRIRFHRVKDLDPRDVLAASPATGDELGKLKARLARMDASGKRGPWTHAVLAQVADHPGVVSTELADALGWERQDFKLHVRRLKALGLTISLEVGYRLSPRGEAYVRQTRGG